MVCSVSCSGGRKRKGWAKRRRRQSGTKSSLKTLPKEDDSDDACKKYSSIFVCWSASLPSNQINLCVTVCFQV